jgi:hypothetical protein
MTVAQATTLVRDAVIFDYLNGNRKRLGLKNLSKIGENYSQNTTILTCIVI